MFSSLVVRAKKWRPYSWAHTPPHSPTSTHTHTISFLGDKIITIMLKIKIWLSKGDIFFASAKTRGIMLYYHFARKFIFKVSFDSQLNYVLHRDKASEHNNHGIRRKLCELKHYLHLVIIWIISLFSVLYLSFIRLIVVLLFWLQQIWIRRMTHETINASLPHN